MKRVISDTKFPAKVWATDLDSQTEQQIKDVANLPFIHKHVAVMPDAHYGKGSTVGTVIATKGAIIPSAIGVDLGCGMCAVKLPISAEVFEKNLSGLRLAIEAVVPVGHRANNSLSNSAAEAFKALGPTTMDSSVDLNRAALQLGSLGSGNHFIELCRDTQGGAWVMLHSGSRNVGKCLAEIHIDKAKELMNAWFWEKILPHEDLAFLSERCPEFKLYIHDMHWAQNYAKANRNEMMNRVLRVISMHLFNEDRGAEKMTEFRVDCHHNYATMENHFGSNVWVTRKGAVSAREGQFGIIPGSMGARSFIVKGLGNPQSFCSCSHGAGRTMSRAEAVKRFKVEDLVKQTEGVECRKDDSVLDEIPGAYKNIDVVMANQADLVTPVFELKQFLCVKGEKDVKKHE